MLNCFTVNELFLHVKSHEHAAKSPLIQALACALSSAQDSIDAGNLTAGVTLPCPCCAAKLLIFINPEGTGDKPELSIEAQT